MKLRHRNRCTPIRRAVRYVGMQLSKFELPFILTVLIDARSPNSDVNIQNEVRRRSNGGDTEVVAYFEQGPLHPHAELSDRAECFGHAGRTTKTESVIDCYIRFDPSAIVFDGKCVAVEVNLDKQLVVIAVGANSDGTVDTVIHQVGDSLMQQNISNENRYEEVFSRGRIDARLLRIGAHSLAPP